MNFSFYKPQLYQDQEFMDKQGDNFVILNFSSHKVKPNFYPEKYPIIDFPMNINIWAEDLDLIVLEYIREKIETAGYGEIRFQPLIILPQYHPIQLLVINIISEVCHCPSPIITYLRQDQHGIKRPLYLIQSEIRKRTRPKRSNFQMNGLVVN
jgi:hypothetical protein